MADYRTSYTSSTSPRGMQQKTYTIYTGGNAAPQLDPLPQKQPQKQPRRQPQERPLTPKQQEELRRRQQAASRNRQRESVMNRSFVVFLGAVTAICAVFFGVYVSMRVSMTSNVSKLGELQTELSELTAANDATEKELSVLSSNLETTKEAAQELGMTYPEDDQVVYYSVYSSDYLNILE